MVLPELGAKLMSAVRKLTVTQSEDPEQLKDALADIARALLMADVNARIVSELRSRITKRLQEDEGQIIANKQKRVQMVVFEELVKMLEPGSQPYTLKRGRSNVVMFVGLQGSGKTTTVAKVANYYSRKGWKTCMVCADTFRAGAFAQLKQNAIRLRIPFYGNEEEADPVRIARDGVNVFRSEQYELIIVDTSGRNSQDAALFAEMQEISRAVQPDTTVFVLDGTQGQVVFEQAKAFKEAVPIGSVIITKLDGNSKGGGAISAVAATKSPIVFIGTGEHLDHIEPFDANSFVSRLLGMGDIKGFCREVSSVFGSGKKKEKEMMERMASGVFAYRDLRDQFQNLLKLGPMSMILDKIPGLSSLIPAGSNGANLDEEGPSRIRKFICILDSMTTDELDGKCSLDVPKSVNIQQIDYQALVIKVKKRQPLTNDEKVMSRWVRIARGSGSLIQEVLVLVTQQKTMERMVKGMNKTGLMKNSGNLMSQIQRNPQSIMQQLSKSIDPRMLAQMGGASQLMDMVKQMAGNEDMIANLIGGDGDDSDRSSKRKGRK